MIYENSGNIPISVAAWLADDQYDYNSDPSTFSATEIIKSVRQIILTRRLSPKEQKIDISSLIASKIGTAIHSAIENTWLEDPQRALELLNYPRAVIDRILINPSSEAIKNNPDGILLYMEQRTTKKLDNFSISGKFDFVREGILEDFKSTSVYTYVHKSSNEKFKLQGSIYKWLNPDKIYMPFMYINYIFMDWKQLEAGINPKYPQQRILHGKLQLYSSDEIENYLSTKLSILEENKNKLEKDLPLCNKEELWQKDSTFKYYKNPLKLARSTKNYKTRQEAVTRFISDGEIGKIVTVKGQAVACRYCAAAVICSQYNDLLQHGIALK